MEVFPSRMRRVFTAKFALKALGRGSVYREKRKRLSFVASVLEQGKEMEALFNT